MSRKLPLCEEDMLKIQHVTRANYLKYGAKLLEITTNFELAKQCVMQLFY